MTPFTIRIPASALGSQELSTADPVAVEKQYHRHAGSLRTNHGSAVAAVRQTVYVARAAGTVTEFRAALSVACVGAATVTFDLLKNGTTVLSAAGQLDSGDAAYDVVEPTISSAAYVADDVFEINVTAAAGGGTIGQGLLALALFDERPA